MALPSGASAAAAIAAASIITTSFKHEQSSPLNAAVGASSNLDSPLNRKSSTGKRQLGRKVSNASAKNLEALDLSNDEAHFPEPPLNSASGSGGEGVGGENSCEDNAHNRSFKAHKTTFTGSVSRESSNEGLATAAGGGDFVTTTDLISGSGGGGEGILMGAGLATNSSFSCFFKEIIVLPWVEIDNLSLGRILISSAPPSDSPRGLFDLASAALLLELL